MGKCVSVNSQQLILEGFMTQSVFNLTSLNGKMVLLLMAFIKVIRQDFRYLQQEIQMVMVKMIWLLVLLVLIVMQEQHTVILDPYSSEDASFNDFQW
ncbi:MAG: Transmembrane protein [Candidatus Midichloria mitochondrii]|uniref:Uncharacterized protein n=1 Tax=Midichloria mitochondrii (strain IricVA) TaxID=696127 RepID=F7XUP8_MIDMI|nr:hypothetical protein midi_00072 [Candidatus Midichloria mitochondrii IricVA]MDJ1288405.1 hypothetical protein [Candidatus Midichloria mitochondrii]